MISNIHTHSTYCDGKNTLEEMVQTAIANGMEALGFSGHSHSPFDPYCPGMDPDKVTRYRSEIGRLSEKYGDRIRLYMGIEWDLDSKPDGLDWDYRIGSIHFMPGNDKYYPIDMDGEGLMTMVKELYHGDILCMVEDYFRRELILWDTVHPDVIGHFDLYRKFNDSLHYLEEQNPKYLSMAKDTLHTLVTRGALFELNLGAVARGKCKEPYPSVTLLSFLQQEGARLIITTDCHDASLLTRGYEQAVDLLKRLGFPSMTVMGKDGFEERPFV